MDILLYKNTSPPNKIQKNIDLVDTIKGVLRKECSIQNPVVTVGNTSFIKSNYCYIPFLGRYYFITDTKVNNDGSNDITLRCDVLMTFKESILDSNQVISRYEKSENYLLPDNEIPIYANNSIEGISGKNQVFYKDKYFYIITTSGKGE